jgi:hypothetical protein
MGVKVIYFKKERGAEEEGDENGPEGYQGL